MVNEIGNILELIEERYGLINAGDRKKALTRAIDQIANTRGLSRSKISEMALENKGLLRELAGYLTVDESYFFRHETHFNIVREYVEKRIYKLKSFERILIWSAGCADGQEPYSLAIALKEHLSLDALKRIHIYASDVSPMAIQRAREAVFADWSFRGVDPTRRDSFFTRCSGGRYQLRKEIREMVQLYSMSIREHCNLLPVRGVDCIFFRNVAMYLSEDVQWEIFERIRSLLCEDGLLIIAPSDVVPPRQSFIRHSSASTSVYRKLHNSMSAFPTWRVPEPRKAQGAASALPASSTINDSGVEFTKLSAGTINAPIPGIDNQSKEIRIAASLANRGNYQSAVTALNDLLEQDTHNKLAYIVRGQIYLASDAFDSAIDDFRQAMFIDPENAVVRFWYAYSLSKGGAVRRSMIQVKNLVSKLSTLGRHSVLEDGHTTAGELLAATIELKEQLA